MKFTRIIGLAGLLLATVHCVIVFFVPRGGPNIWKTRRACQNILEEIIAHYDVKEQNSSKGQSIQTSKLDGWGFFLSYRIIEASSNKLVIEMHSLGSDGSVSTYDDCVLLSTVQLDNKNVWKVVKSSFYVLGKNERVRQEK